MARQSFSYRTRDGRLLEWSGTGVSLCTTCEELFGSVTAFDAHIKRKPATAPPRHDTSKLHRNGKGWLVTEAWEGLPA